MAQVCIDVLNWFRQLVRIGTLINKLDDNKYTRYGGIVMLDAERFDCKVNERDR